MADSGISLHSIDILVQLVYNYGGVIALNLAFRAICFLLLW